MLTKYDNIVSYLLVRKNATSGMYLTGEPCTSYGLAAHIHKIETDLNCSHFSVSNLQISEINVIYIMCFDHPSASVHHLYHYYQRIDVQVQICRGFIPWSVAKLMLI